MSAKVLPPIAPMLAKLARELPRGDYLYEPKWDGFRCLAFRDHDAIDLRSRHDSRLARYFPELVEGLQGVDPQHIVLDGEIILVRETGSDFEALMTRLHPAASRVKRLRAEIPASYVAFDVLALDEADLRGHAFAERRRVLEAALGNARPPIYVTPVTTDADTAAGWFRAFQGAGVDGVIAKHRELRYEPGKRAMIKIKHERTADCVVAGVRLYVDTPALSSLVLALYDDAGALQHVGVVTSFPVARRAPLLAELMPLAIPLADHPWRDGFTITRSPLGRLKGAAGRWMPGMGHDWIPLRPERVVEVAFDQVDGYRFRHPARFRRWRADRDPRSCTVDQLVPPALDLPGMLARA